MDEYGCFLCGKGKATDIKAQCEHCGSAIDVIEDLLRCNYNSYAPKDKLGRGYYGYVLLAENRIGTKFALKIVPETLYQAQQKDFWDEVKKYQLAGQHQNIAELYDAGETIISISGKELRVYYLVTEYLRGAENLEVFIEKKTSTIDTLVGFASQICGVLTHLDESGLWHNDLHARNILVTPRPKSEFNHHKSVDYVFNVVDFGSAVFGNPGSVKKYSDIQWLATHLNTIRSKAYKNALESGLPPYEIKFLEKVPSTYHAAFDDVPSRRPSASQIWRSIENLWAEYSTQTPWRPPQLSSAFSYPNASEIPDESYIMGLFSRELPWLKQTLDTETNLLLTGPRGCGKTMFLRANSLRAVFTRLKESETPQQQLERVKNSKIIGFFVSCRTSIQIYLATGQRPEWLDDPALVLLFINLLFGYEMTDTFITASRMDIKLLNIKEEEQLLDTFAKLLGHLAPMDLYTNYGGLTPLEKLRTLLVQIQNKIENGEISGKDVPIALQGPKFLSILSEFLSEGVDKFKGKKVVFLLDDFTKPIIPEFAQQSYLPVAFYTGKHYSFWVSAHSMSIPKQDLNMVTYDSNREYRELNLGREFATTLKDKFDVCTTFLDDVFQRRFELSNKYVGKTLRDLLGDSDYGDKLAEHIRYCSKNNKRLYYHGYNTIVRLCTGDISYIIDLLGRILAGKDGKGRPSKLAQNKVIRIYARQELILLREIHDVGRDLYRIALWFGKLSRKLLMGNLVGKEERPAEYLRIELEFDKALTTHAEEMLNNLLRHGIFIDGGLGSSRTSIPTRVLFYRRIFIPAAPASLGDKDTFAWNSSKFEKFVNDPEAFVDQEAKAAGSKDLFLDFDL